jgi:addiction module RelB/DinJ family antitoxin
MTATNIHIRTDSELEAKAQSVLDHLGMDMTTAFNLFLTQMVDKEALPFEMDKSNVVVKKRPRSEVCGILKGKVWMADDFDAPLEEMREYME